MFLLNYSNRYFFTPSLFVIMWLTGEQISCILISLCSPGTYKYLHVMQNGYLKRLSKPHLQPTSLCRCQKFEIWRKIWVILSLLVIGVVTTHPSGAPQVNSEVHVAQYLIFCVVFGQPLCVILLLVIVLSVHRYTSSDYSFIQ